MTFIIQSLTTKMMFVIIVALDLNKPDETHTPSPQEYP